MQINLAAMKPPAPGERAVEPFEAELDLSALQRFGERPFPEPVKVCGEVSLQHGEWTVRYRADYLTRQSCSRCLGPAERRDSLEASHPVIAEEREELSDSYIQAPGAILDLKELVGADLCLSLEGVALCREDCKGLCPVCGANRNEADCGCAPDHKPTDPRFDALKKLIEEQ